MAAAHRAAASVAAGAATSSAAAAAVPNIAAAQVASGGDKPSTPTTAAAAGQAVASTGTAPDWAGVVQTFAATGGLPKEFLLRARFLLYQNDILHNAKNAEQQVWKKASALHISRFGSLSPISLQGYVFSLARFHKRVRGAHNLLCSYSQHLGLPPPERMAKDVSHRLMVVTDLSGHILQYALAYEVLLAEYEHVEAEQQQQASDAQGKLQHLKEIVVTMRNPLLQVMLALVAHVHPSSCALYTQLNSKGGFAAPNTRTWLRAYADTLMGVAHHPEGVLASQLDMQELRGRFGADMQELEEVAVGDFLKKLRAGHSGDTPTYLPDSLQKHLQPQLFWGNKAGVQAPSWIAQQRDDLRQHKQQLAAGYAAAAAAAAPTAAAAAPAAPTAAAAAPAAPTAAAAAEAALTAAAAPAALTAAAAAPAAPTAAAAQAGQQSALQQRPGQQQQRSTTGAASNAELAALQALLQLVRKLAHTPEHGTRLGSIQVQRLQRLQKVKRAQQVQVAEAHQMQQDHVEDAAAQGEGPGEAVPQQQDQTQQQQQQQQQSATPQEPAEQQQQEQTQQQPAQDQTQQQQQKPASTNLQALPVVLQYIEAGGRPLKKQEWQFCQAQVDFVQSFFEARPLSEVLSSVSAAFRAAVTYFLQAAAPHISSINAQVAAAWHPGPVGTTNLLHLLHMKNAYHAGGP